MAFEKANAEISGSRQQTRCRRLPGRPRRVLPGKKAPAAGKSRSRRPIRWKRSLAVLLVLSMILCVLPLTASDVPIPSAPSSLYNVNDDLLALQAEKDTRFNSPDVLRETRNVLDNLRPKQIEKTGPAINYSLVTTPSPNLAAPQLFDKAESNANLNGTTIIEFLLQQPLNYWVYTSYGGCDTWSKGFLRPSIDFTVDSTGFHIVDWERWVEVDSDQNSTTGDGNGNEIRARISLVLENYTFERPRLESVIPPQMSDWYLNFTGGLRLQVQRLTNSTASAPMEVAFLKAFMYRGFNYIWIISFNYTDVPTTFEAILAANKVSAHGNVRELIGNVLQNFSLGSGSALADITGPYNIFVHTTPIDSLTATIGYAKAINRQLTERSWIIFVLSTAPGLSDLPRNISFWLDSPSFNSSFNHMKWTADAKCRVEATLCENRTNLTLAHIVVQDIPTFFEVKLDNRSAEDPPHSLMRFDASSRIALFEYNAWEFYGEQRVEYKYVHAKVVDLPTSVQLKGSFEVGGPSPPPINNELGIGFVARIIDNVMTRIANKFYTFARTLRSIPENVLRMPERDGWVQMTMPPGEAISALEVWITSGPHIEREGSFLSFYNLTMPQTTNPVMNVSFSLRIQGLAGIDSDFRHGTHMELRTAVRQKLSAIFIDVNQGSNASLEIVNLPPLFILDVNETTRCFTVTASEKVQRILYAGWVQEQFLQLSIEDIPSQFSVRQLARSFSIDVPPPQALGRVEILSTNADLWAMEGNYLLVRSDGRGTSFGAAFSGLEHAGYSTGVDGKLELCLTTTDPLAIYVEDTQTLLRGRVLISPFPRSMSFGVAEMLGSGRLRVPDLMKATSIMGFSSAVFAITNLGADVLGIADQITGMLDDQMSGLGKNTTMTVRTDGNTVVVGDIQKGNITEAPWTHGISSRQVVTGKNTTLFNTKIFLRLPAVTTLRTRTDGDTMNFSIEMTDFHPRFDWMVVDLKGIQGRDLFAYLTDMGTSINLRLSANITQNSTYGNDQLRADMDLACTKPLGPFIASLSRGPPVNSRFLAFASGLPESLKLTAYLGEKLEMKYNARGTLDYLFIKNSRLVKETWHSLTAILHDVPREVEATLSPSEHFDAGSTPVQMLPEFSIIAGSDTLDLLVDLDGKATGQRSSYQLEVKDAGKQTTGRNSGQFYKVRSTGAESVYVVIRDMPYQKGLRITALGLLIEDVRSLDLTIPMVFGAYPVFQLSALDASSVHLSARSKIDAGGGEKEGRLSLCDIRTTGGFPAGLHLFTNGLAGGPSRGEDHTVVPMPLLTLLGTLLGGGA